MKVILLAGGQGSRMGEVTEELPKPLIKIGKYPIIYHIMNIYASRGFKDFIIACGYNAPLMMDFAKNLKNNWNVECYFHGIDVTKSYRLKQLESLFKDKTFFVSYGDDLSDVNPNDILKFHQEKGQIATITAVNVKSDFGIVDIGDNNDITKFIEKPKLDLWMNGGYMVFDREIFKYLELGELEQEVFDMLVRLKQINAFKHHGEWDSMNTLKDYNRLNKLWEEKKAFWRR